MNVLLVAIVGFSLWGLVSAQLAEIPDRRRVIALVAGFFLVGLGAYLTGLSAGVVVTPDTLPEKIVKLILALLIVWGLVSVLGLSILWVIILFIVIPSNVRKALGLLTALMVSIVLLSVVNSHFGWEWNFPDIFGLVSGLLALAFTLSDRYLTRKKAQSPGLE
jgi:MFS family permease